MTETARARLAERARMIGRIRRGVIVAVLAAFVLAWGVIAATGSMGTATASTATGDGSTSTSDGTTSSSDATGSSGGSSGAVTTSQS